MFCIKNKKIGIPFSHLRFIKVWFKGVYVSWICFPDAPFWPVCLLYSHINCKPTKVWQIVLPMDEFH